MGAMLAMRRDGWLHPAGGGDKRMANCQQWAMKEVHMETPAALLATVFALGFQFTNALNFWRPHAGYDVLGSAAAQNLASDHDRLACQKAYAHTDNIIGKVIQLMHN